MKFGISAFAWTSSFRSSHLDIVPRVRDFGYAGLEIPMFRPTDLRASELRRAFSSNHLDCTVCMILPDGINPISQDAETRKRSLSHLTRCVETAAELGAHLLGGPLLAPIGYLPNHRPKEEEWKWAADSVRALIPLLEKYGITLSIEPVNRSETFFIRTAEDGVRFCKAVSHPLVGITIDTFHANIEDPSIPRALEVAGSHLKHIHLSENHRGPLGTGHINMEEIAESLESTSYGGYVVIEAFGFSQEEPDAPGFLWSPMDTAPESVAKDGLALLNRLFSRVSRP
jgi:D-psicose/D-tagatose/L-ribulose 3-epimerase